MTDSSNMCFLVAQAVKNPPAMRETWVRSLGWKDPLEEGMTTHSSILAWRIPWTGAWRAAVHGATKSRTRLSDSVQHRALLPLSVIAKCPWIRPFWPFWSLQLWPTLCDSVDYTPSGSSLHGITTARIFAQECRVKNGRGDFPF